MGVSRLGREQDQALRPRRPRPVLARDGAAGRLSAGRFRRRLRRGPPCPALRERGPRGRGRLRRRRASPHGGGRPVLAPRGGERAARHERGRHRCLLPRLPRPLRAPLSSGGGRALRGLRRCLLRRRDRRGRRDRLPRRSPGPHLSASWLTGYEAGPSLRFRAETGPAPSPSHKKPSSRPASSSPRRPPACAPHRTRPTTSSSLPGPFSTPPSHSSTAASPRASPPSPPPSRRSPPPSVAGRSPPRPSATSSPSPTTSGDGPRPATSSSSATPTTTPGASTPPPSRPPCPSFSRRPPTSGPHPTPLWPPSTATISSPTSPSAASRHHAGAGPDDGRQDPRLGGPGQNLDGKGRTRRRQPRPRRRLRGRRSRHRELLPRGRDTTESSSDSSPNRDVARAQILDAFNEGLSLISYVGHGGGAVGPARTSSTPQTPLPPRPAPAALHAHHELPQRLLHRALLPFPRRGIPQGPGQGHDRRLLTSGLSLDGPAHRYHRAVMQEITSGHHERIGDAILAAQRTYAPDRSLPRAPQPLPPLRDPAMRVRP